VDGVAQAFQADFPLEEIVDDIDQILIGKQRPRSLKINFGRFAPGK